MIKQMIAVIVVMLAGGAWLFLDCMNQREMGSAEILQQEIAQARAEAKKRADYKKNFDVQLTTTMKICVDAAEKSKLDHMALVEQLAPRRRGKAVIPQAILDESEKILNAAKDDCQLDYDRRMKNGV